MVKKPSNVGILDQRARTRQVVAQRGMVLAFPTFVRELSIWLRDLDLHRGVRSGEPGGGVDDARLHRPGHLDGI